MLELETAETDRGLTCARTLRREHAHRMGARGCRKHDRVALLAILPRQGHERRRLRIETKLLTEGPRHITGQRFELQDLVRAIGRHGERHFIIQHMIHPRTANAHLFIEDMTGQQSGVLREVAARLHARREPVGHLRARRQ